MVRTGCFRRSIQAQAIPKVPQATARQIEKEPEGADTTRTAGLKRKATISEAAINMYCVPAERR
jgi:hypothetical protein